MPRIDLQYFGGRGASSASGKSGMPRRTQTDHMDEWNPPPDIAEQLAKANGISIDEAREQAIALADYSGSDYRAIRKAQYEGLTDWDEYAKAQAIENFIAQSPVWAGGELYRGVKLDAASVNHLKVGGRIDMKGMSSWSSDEITANSFSNSSTKERVIFRTKGTKQGTSITHLSSFGKGESEVLISGKATWTIKKITKSGGRTYIDVEED